MNANVIVLRFLSPLETVVETSHLQPSRSSNPFPRLAEPLPVCPALAMLGVDAIGLDCVGAGAPQIPAELFAFAILAKSGPFEAPVFCLDKPAVDDAVDHKELNTSPLAAGFVVDVGFPSVEAEVEENDGCWTEEGKFGRLATGVPEG